jgi:hypothetical protein
MDVADGIGPGEHEDFGAALLRSPAKIGGGQPQIVDLGAHGAVVDEHALTDFLKVSALVCHYLPCSPLARR